ncbi:MAG: hypothetical protein PWQ37_858 [Candidatus Petromonas sp.]|nr:hypothetical protein [Candidatus Petromonas sp.]
MKDILCDEFQNSVEDVLTRHKSILDIITKLQESSARINRAVIKSITSCGCVTIKASKQELPDNISYDEVKNYMDNHLKGNLCESCREKIEEEIGNNLFYLAALSNTLDINLYDVILKECKQIGTLGKFSLY